jgi:hypothetical protein
MASFKSQEFPDVSAVFIELVSIYRCTFRGCLCFLPSSGISRPSQHSLPNMGNKIRPRFLDGDSFIDKDCTTVLLPDGATSGLLLSSTSTTTFPKMQLKKHRQDSTSSNTHSQLSMRDRDFERRTVACRQTSKELHHHTRSVSSIDSNPGLTDDPFVSTSPNSDTSFEDLCSVNPSAVDVESEKLWCEYPLEDVKGSLFDSPSYPNSSPGVRDYLISDTQYSPRSQSPISPEAFLPYPSELHRSDAVRSTRDRSRTVNARTQPTYTAFPATVPNAQPGTLPPTGHNSWPQRTDSRMKRRARPRALTEPGDNRPSNLNVCVPVNNNIQYMPPPYLHGHQSAPQTPMALAGLQSNNIVDQYVSYESRFDEDEDDDEDRSFRGSLSRLYRRGSSNASGSLGKKSTMEKQKKHPRKSLSEIRDALKCCFGKCK